MNKEQIELEKIKIEYATESAKIRRLYEDVKSRLMVVLGICLATLVGIMINTKEFMPSDRLLQGAAFLIMSFSLITIVILKERRHQADRKSDKLKAKTINRLDNLLRDMSQNQKN